MGEHLSDTNSVSQPQRPSRNTPNAHMPDPSRANAALTRWRSKLGKENGVDHGANLDRPDRRLVMLKIFGETRRLSDLCMAYPATAATALIDGAAPVLAEMARQLTSLSWGIGGAEALHATLTPIKDRADIAIAIALLNGEWQLDEAAAARADLAERICETALAWLIRGAVKRGEFSIGHTVCENDNHDPMSTGTPDDTKFNPLCTHGIFVVASGDFAHQDGAGSGPLDLAVVFEPTLLADQRGVNHQRTLIRIGAEFREAIEGRPGSYALYHLKTPFGSKVNGAGLVESSEDITKLLKAPNAEPLRRWFATARIVAGDRRRGGEFLEMVEDFVWSDRPLLNRDMTNRIERAQGDALGLYREITDLCRLTMGRKRPLFRTAPALDVIQTAAQSHLIPQPMAARLTSGLQTAQMLQSVHEFVGSSAAGASAMREHSQSHAALCGFDSLETMTLVMDGIIADARSCLQQLMFGPRRAFERYTSDIVNADDPAKLEDLGFIDGAYVSSVIEAWMAPTNAPVGTPVSPSANRFSARAPGLLTAFGETQYPNDAIKLFDQLVTGLPDPSALDAILAADGAKRDQFVAVLGCFPQAVAPLIAHNPAFMVSLEGALDQSTQDEHELAANWLSRHQPPASKAGPEGLATWRQLVIAELAAECAAGAMTFLAAADVLSELQWLTLSLLFETLLETRWSDDRKTLQNLSVFGCGGEWQALPGDRATIGFLLTSKTAAAATLELAGRFAADFTDALGKMGSGMFEISVDVSRRPGGPTAPLVASATAWQQYVKAEATAYDQLALARTNVFAGTDKAREGARLILREVVSNPRRTQMTLRELDRARGQVRMRASRTAAAQSVWDFDQRDGTRRDVELMINVLYYRHIAATPFIEETSTRNALFAMADSGLIDAEAAHSLVSAREFWMQLGIAKALSGWSNPDISPVRSRFGALLARACGVTRFDQTAPMIRGYCDDGNRLYGQIVLGRDERQATVA